MVNVTFFQDRTRLRGFTCSGHADYTDGEPDIVCSAVSALVITCINSVETLTEDVFRCSSDKDSGSIQFFLEEGSGEKSQLLLNSLALGLEELESSYKENIDLIFEEVQET